MTDWWEQPYKGGPMVAVPGFPRIVTVGDEPGDDVLGYQRTVKRLQRWAVDEPFSSLDRVYSQAFATGKPGTGGNVGWTGVAGVQRQQNMPDTGVIDQKTFNTLRSARVPAGPNKGQMAMDANAANLIALAYQKYNPAVLPTSAEARLEEAISWLGYTEEPAGTNNTTFGEWYGVNYQPWCAIFCTYCDQLGGHPTRSFVRGSRYAYVPYVVADATAGANGLSIANAPAPGDLVCYDWARDGTFDHIGILEHWNGTSPSSFTAIEGNTSTSNDSNGGQVMRRTRDTREQNTLFVRVAEP